MIKIHPFYFVFLASIVTTCSTPNFNRQKFTDLKPFESTGEVKYLSPPDSVLQDVYIQTEKKFYFMENATFDTTTKVVSADEILRCSESEINESALVIKISEKDFTMIDAVELNKSSGVYQNGNIIPKDQIHNYLPMSEAGSVKVKKHKKTKRRNGLKAGAIIAGFMGFFASIMGMILYNESKNADDGTCIGAFAAASLLASAIFFAYAAGFFIIICIVFVIVLATRK